jgi:peptide chain release factor subunit 1
MITNQVVRDLIQFAGQDYPVTSAYFAVQGKAGIRKAHLVELKQLIRYKKNTTYFKQLSETEQNSVLEDFEKILRWFSVELDTAVYPGSICFSSAKAGFWKVMNLKIPLTNELVIQPKPYIYQLSKLFSSYRRYGVVLVDKAKARIFEQSLGNFHELLHVVDNSPENVKVGGFKGRQERKVERSIHQGVLNHYKEIAQKLFDLNKSRDFPWIILGGRKEATAEFRKHLHDYVDGKIRSVFEIEPSAPLNEVFEKVTEVSKKARQEFEQNLIEAYHVQKEKGLALEGIEAVLPKLRDSWIQTLIIGDNFQRKGVFCRKCYYIDLTPSAKCPEHGDSLERTQNIIEHILHVGLRYGVNIQYVSQPMERYGEIAAILRYPLTA